jgi:hypothetical protein
MEISEHKTKISASELANLWTQYINDSLARCMFRYFLNHVQDKDIMQVLQYAFELTERHLRKVEEFLNAIEISGTFLNLQKTMTKSVLELAFGQVAKSKEVRKYMERARHLCNDHFRVLSSMLIAENLPIPMTFESEVTDSTIPPFSDKLMMFHVASLLSSAIGYYGEALALSQRMDLAANYAKMIAEIGLLAEDGMNLLIGNEWMEQPPLATDREDLAKNKGCKEMEKKDKIIESILWSISSPGFYNC